MPLFLFLLALSFPSLFASEGVSLSHVYQKNSHLQWDLAIESLSHFPLNPTDKVLDVGSGDGKITAHIAKLVPNGVVVGLDVSKNMVNTATSLFQKSNLLFIQGTATQIPFKNQFDKIVSFSTLHWVLEQDVAINSLKESLKEGGAMLLLLYGKAPNNIGAIAEKITSLPKWSPYFPTLKKERVYFDLDEYKDLLTEANLLVTALSNKQVTYLYKDRASLTQFTKPLINFIDHLPLTLQSEFVEDFLDEMLINDPPFPDGSIGIRYSVIEAIAIKRTL